MAGARHRHARRSSEARRGLVEIHLDRLEEGLVSAMQAAGRRRSIRTDSGLRLLARGGEGFFLAWWNGLALRSRDVAVTEPPSKPCSSNSPAEPFGVTGPAASGAVLRDLPSRRNLLRSSPNRVNPLLFVSFTVLPRIGRQVKRGCRCQLCHHPGSGLVAVGMVFKAFPRSLPLSMELGATREIEDRVLRQSRSSSWRSKSWSSAHPGVRGAVSSRWSTSATSVSIHGQLALLIVVVAASLTSGAAAYPRHHRAPAQISSMFAWSWCRSPFWVRVLSLGDAYPVRWLRSWSWSTRWST